ncbi:MAG: hypothetical protein H6654_03330 [Ardenticatenaceae bacterium]|nr:hypothetical protein [Anaerolineales bacterium]MCB8941225.1 hypothetical protein [Ardenticatenaceae bacterium]MCB8972564.1 hypothetical protein [Ardenticatenaceae bacterium]
MNKQKNPQERRPVPGAHKANFSRLRSKTRLMVVGTIFFTVLVVAVTALAQSFNVNLAGGDNAEVACEGRGMQVQRLSRTAVNIICSGSDNPQPTVEPTNPPPQPTQPPIEPTNPPPQPTTPPPQPTSPPPPPVGNIQPFAGAPACEDIGVAHDARAWHGIWNYQYGCHWSHEHKQNPHEVDYIFGTEYYSLAGGELSYPWQTYSGAGEAFEAYAPGAMLENEGKHEGYAWHHFTNGLEICDQSLLLGNQCFDSFRVETHQIGGEMGALTRFHSVYAEGIACTPEGAARMQFNGSAGAYGRTINNQFYPLTRDNINQFPAEFAGCGFGSGGGWLDFGRLNWPERGILQPLPTDNPQFANFGQFGPPEAAPYRIHPNGSQNSLDSWQSEGNVFNCLGNDPNCEQRIMVGFGLHILQGESVGMTNPANASLPMSQRQTHFWCVDPVTKLFNCNPQTSPGGNDNTAQALFRAWIAVPTVMDGSRYDEDGARNGAFTFHGYTNRYGDVVEGCTAPGLDCVPTRFEQFPVGNCGQTACKAAYRGSTDRDGWDALSVDGTPIQSGGTPLIPAGELWLKYPN